MPTEQSLHTMTQWRHDGDRRYVARVGNAEVTISRAKRLGLEMWHIALREHDQFGSRFTKERWAETLPAAKDIGDDLILGVWEAGRGVGAFSGIGLGGAVKINWQPNHFAPGASAKIPTPDGRTCTVWIFGPQGSLPGKWEVYNDDGTLAGRFVGGGRTESVSAGKRAAMKAIEACLVNPFAGEVVRRAPRAPRRDY